MNSRTPILIAILIGFSCAHAQPDSLWSRTYGGSNWDVCCSLQQTGDGGYVLGGSTRSYGSGNYDFWLVKTDANGDSLWSRTFGGGDDDYCSSVQQTGDGGFVLAGYTESFGSGDHDFWLVRTDAGGDSLWSRAFGGSNAEQCWSLQQTDDGGYVLAGWTNSFGAGDDDVWLVKMDANGDSLWSRTFGGSNTEQCWSLRQTSDGGYALGGATRSYGSGDYDFWLVKTDANGDSLWSRTFGGSRADYCRSLQQTTDGGLVLGGDTGSDIRLVKTDANGDSLWGRTYGGSDDHYCRSLQQTRDGGYVLGGITQSRSDLNIDFYLMKTDAGGNRLWSRTFGGSWEDYSISLQQTGDGGYILGGDTHSFGAGGFDIWLVKTGPDPTIDADERFIHHPTSFNLSVYPNPFNSELTLSVTGFTRNVRISLHNLLGQEVDLVHDGALFGTQLHYTAPASLSSGVYLVHAADAVQQKTAKVVLLK